MTKRRPPRSAHPRRPGHRMPIGGERRIRSGGPRESELVAGVRQAMRSDHPLELLSLVSTMLVAIEPRRETPFAEQPATVTRQELLESFLDIRISETSAILAVATAMIDDELLRARVDRELASRRSFLPAWLNGLRDVEVYRAVEMVHVLRDGDDIILGVRLPTGEELTAIVYIDHNVGTLVKDAFAAAEPIDDVIAFMRQRCDDPDTAWNDISLADARARTDHAIATAAITWPPFESDSWPACRPLIEWLVRTLPADGVGDEFREWADEELRAVADSFFASRFGIALDDEEYRSLLDDLLWFGSTHGTADPMRWSAVAVEIVLTDWIPRKIVADVEHLAKAPELLRAFIAFCHSERGIRPSLTAEALAAVDEWEPDYQELIRSPRPQGAEALLAAMGVLRDGADADAAGVADADASAGLHDAQEAMSRYMVGRLRGFVGGDAALRTLEVASLPDEEFDWSGVRDDALAAVAETLALCDAGCDELFDVEHRTACRRLLADLARRKGALFGSGTRADQTAAAICWIVAKANNSFGTRPGERLVRDVVAHFGTRVSPSQRAGVLLRAGSFTSEDSLGSPRYLTSARRRGIIVTRDRHLAHG